MTDTFRNLEHTKTAQWFSSTLLVVTNQKSHSTNFDATLVHDPWDPSLFCSLFSILRLQFVKLIQKRGFYEWYHIKSSSLAKSGIESWECTTSNTCFLRLSPDQEEEDSIPLWIKQNWFRIFKRWSYDPSEIVDSESFSRSSRDFETPKLENREWLELQWVAWGVNRWTLWTLPPWRTIAGAICWELPLGLSCQTWCCFEKRFASLQLYLRPWSIRAIRVDLELVSVGSVVSLTWPIPLLGSIGKHGGMGSTEQIKSRSCLFKPPRPFILIKLHFWSQRPFENISSNKQIQSAWVNRCLDRGMDG